MFTNLACFLTKWVGGNNLTFSYTSNFKWFAGPAVWQKAGDQGNVWQFSQAEIHLDGPHDSFRILIEGVTGNSFYGDIAIDDIIVLDQACNMVCSTVGIWHT